MKNQGFIHQNARGNALIFILVIIALLSALTITITRMGETENDVSREEATLKASQIARYMLSLKGAVDKLIASGVSENDICFDHDNFKNGSAAESFYFSACDNSANKLFAPEGAGLSARPATDFLPDSYWGVWGHLAIEDVGTTAPELVMQMTGVSLPVCVELNRMSGLGAPQSDTASSPPRFLGTYGAYNSSFALGDMWTDLEGKQSGCRQSGTGYFYYQVLLAR